MAEKEKEQNTTSIGTGIAAVIVVVLGFLLLSSCSNRDYTDDELEQAGKWKSCSDRSSTYYKCSWSHSEDRCVCKQR